MKYRQYKLSGGEYGERTIGFIAKYNYVLRDHERQGIPLIVRDYDLILVDPTQLSFGLNGNPLRRALNRGLGDSYDIFLVNSILGWGKLPIPLADSVSKTIDFEEYIKSISQTFAYQNRDTQKPGLLPILLNPLALPSYLFGKFFNRLEIGQPVPEGFINDIIAPSGRIRSEDEVESGNTVKRLDKTNNGYANFIKLAIENIKGSVLACVDKNNLEGIVGALERDLVLLKRSTLELVYSNFDLYPGMDGDEFPHPFADN